MRHLSRHADAFAQRGVWVDGLANVHGVCAHLAHFGVRVGDAGDDAGVEGGGPEFLGWLFVTLHQLTGNHFSRHMRFVHRLVRQHGLTDDVANGEDVRHVGAHLDIDVDEAAVGDGDTSFLGGDFFAVGRAACFALQSDDYLRMGERLAAVGLPTVLVFEGGYAVDAVG